MRDWLSCSALDRRYFYLWAIPAIFIFVVTTVLTMFMGMKAAFEVSFGAYICAVIFGMPAWIVGFRFSYHLSCDLRLSALIAGLASFVFAMIGGWAVIEVWSNTVGYQVKFPGFLLVVLVPFIIFGVRYLYRPETWTARRLPQSGGVQV
jgi:hypothetical protein